MTGAFGEEASPAGPALTRCVFLGGMGYPVACQGPTAGGVSR